MLRDILDNQKDVKNGGDKNEGIRKEKSSRIPMLNFKRKMRRFWEGLTITFFFQYLGVCESQ